MIFSGIKISIGIWRTILNFYPIEMSQTPIQERINSYVQSDVIASYVDINSIAATKNIIPGSTCETIQQCIDENLSNINNAVANGAGFSTRFPLAPSGGAGNATCVQTMLIDYEAVIPGNSLALQITDVPGNEPDVVEQRTATTTAHRPSQPVDFRLFYNNASCIASHQDIAIEGETKITSDRYNDIQSVLVTNSLPDTITSGSVSETTLSSLADDPYRPCCGSDIISVNTTTGVDAGVKYPITHDIPLRGTIDLSRVNPTLRNFPIILASMKNLYYKLIVENFLKDLRIVYLNRDGSLAPAGPNAPNVHKHVPMANTPAGKAQFYSADGRLFKVRLINIQDDATAYATFNNDSKPIHALKNCRFEKFEIIKKEFKLEEYSEILASQANSIYKFPIHQWKTLPFQQTNNASNFAQNLQAYLHAHNIDSIYITETFLSEHPAWLPTPSIANIHPIVADYTILPRAEKNLSNAVAERIFNTFVDTDKHSPPQDLIHSIVVPTMRKCYTHTGVTVYRGQQNDVAGNASVTGPTLYSVLKGDGGVDKTLIIPNKFSYSFSCNTDGFRKGINSVVTNQFSPERLFALQQTIIDDSMHTSLAIAANVPGPEAVLSSLKNFYGTCQYGQFWSSNANSYIHCLCDRVCMMSFDQYGNLVTISSSEHI
jgi:hypothetical protein